MSFSSQTELNTDVAGDFTSQLATNTEDASDMIEEELQSAVELLSAVVEYSFSNLSVRKFYNLALTQKEEAQQNVNKVSFSRKNCETHSFL